MDNTNRILAIIPCYNEEKSIPRLIQQFAKTSKNIDWLIIDDGSTDRTYEVAKKYGQVIKLLRNLGIGGAVQTGIKYAYQMGYGFCIQIDGDGQHLPGTSSGERQF